MEAPNTGSIEPQKNGTDGDSLLAEVRGLIARNDPIACQWWVEWAEKLPAEVAVPALCVLLEPPRGFRNRLRWRSEAWGRVRAEAAQALEHFGAPYSIPPLIHALVYDPNPTVRSHVARALCSFGSEAVPEMLAMLRRAENWPLEGMNALLRTLSDLKDRRAGPSLASTLFGDLPLSPSRWTRRPLIRSTYFAGLASLLTAFALRPSDLPSQWFLGLSLLLFLPFWALSYLFLSLPLSMIQSGRERNVLYTAAADALIALQDKQALPSMIVIAFGSHTGTARVEAYRVLRALLPLLRPEDAELLSPSQERQLLDALGMANAELALAIVRALEFVGTGQAAGPVGRLLRHYYIAAGWPVYATLRAETERILPLLQARLNQEQAASVLLRPSDLPHNAPGEMLRPALDPASTPAEQLLRPTSDHR